ncbi:MAG TPA: hypothetical protein VFN35_23640 [Ktedonobacteraceae bacterium]|nr:hypothetical protein [Ktedonobacteraceae bacterium]
MESNIYKHINQEMKFFEICLDMAKQHVEDVLLTLALLDDQRIPLSDRAAVNKEYLQELNRQLGKIFTEMNAWRIAPQATGSEQESDSPG